MGFGEDGASEDIIGNDWCGTYKPDGCTLPCSTKDCGTCFYCKREITKNNGL